MFHGIQCVQYYAMRLRKVYPSILKTLLTVWISSESGPRHQFNLHRAEHRQLQSADVRAVGLAGASLFFRK